MKNRSNWRSVRIEETALEQQLHQRHSLRLHGWCIGSLTMGLTWATSHLQMVVGAPSMAVRYLVSLGVGYVGYLIALRLWGAWLLRRAQRQSGDDEPVDAGDLLDGADLALEAADLAVNTSRGLRVPSPRSALDADDASSGAWPSLDGSALDGVGDLDEAAIVVVPVVAVFLIAGAVFFGAGALFLVYFGWEALLAVAIELAFSVVTARTAVRVAREGWVQAAVRLTWKPLFGAMICAVALGLLLDHFVPQAQSLPDAVKLLRQR